MKVHRREDFSTAKPESEFGIGTLLFGKKITFWVREREKKREKEKNKKERIKK